MASITDTRRGNTIANTELDQLATRAGQMSTDQLAGLLADEQIIGHPETETTPSSSPVGLWVIAQLQAAGVPAVAYSWVSTLAVYDADRWLLGEVHIPAGHTMYELVCEVNDLDRPELTFQGESDER